MSLKIEEHKTEALKIETLNIEFPASLGGRKHSILRLLRSELLRLDWPAGRIEKLLLPAISISSQQTNLGIARALAFSLLKATEQERTANNRRRTDPGFQPASTNKDNPKARYQGGMQ